MAASHSLYEKLTGLSSKDEIIDKAAIDLTADDEPGPSKKKRLQSCDDFESGMAEIMARLDKWLAFIDELAQSFQCVICKSLAREPVVLPCCQWMVGCHSCIEHWFDGNSRCPLCSTTEHAQERFKLRCSNGTYGILSESA